MHRVSSQVAFVRRESFNRWCWAAILIVHADSSVNHNQLLNFLSNSLMVNFELLFLPPLRLPWFLLVPLNSYYILTEQGRIHGYRSRVRVGRGHIWGHRTIWAGAVRSKNRIHEKSKSVTDRPTEGQTKRGVESRSTRLKTSSWEQRRVRNIVTNTVEENSQDNKNQLSCNWKVLHSFK